MTFKRLIFTFNITFAAVSTANASIRCESVFASASVILDGRDSGYITDLVRLSLDLETMSEGSAKAMLMQEFKDKFQEAIEKYGDGFREEFLAKRAATASNYQEQVRDQQDQRTQSLTQAQEIARRWSRTDEIPDVQAPRNGFNAVFYDENTVVFTKKNKIVFYDLKENRETRRLDVKGLLFTKHIQVSADKKFLFVANPALMKIEIDNPANIQTVPNALDGVQSTPTSLKISPDGQTIALGGYGGQSSFFKTSDLSRIGGWNRVNTELGTPAITRDLSFAADGRSALVQREQENAMLFDIATGKAAASVAGIKRTIKSPRESSWKQARFIPGRDALFVLNQSGNMRVWDLKAKKIIEFKSRDTFDRAFVTPDGQSVVVLKLSGLTENGPVIDVYDLTTGKPRPFSMPEGWGRTRFLAYNTEGTKLALRESENESGESNRIAILDLATLDVNVARLSLPAGRNLPTGPASLNAEGTRLLVADYEGEFVISIH